MLDILIRYFEKFLNFLKNRQKKDVLWEKEVAVTGKWSKIFIMLIWILLSVWIMYTWYWLVEYEDLLENSWVLIILFFIWLLLTQIFLLTTLFKNLNWKYLFLVHIPLYIGLISIFLVSINGFTREFWLYNTILNILLGVYSLISILQFYFKKLVINKYINKLKKLFYFYNLGFFFFLALNTLIISLWFNIGFIQPWSEIIIEILSENNIRWLEEFLLIFIGTFIFLLYWIYSLHVYFDISWKKRSSLYKWVITFILIYMLWFSSSLIDWFYDNQIERASETLREEWYNYESYKDAKVMFLDRAFYNRIKDGRGIDEDLFKKIYDTTPEWYYWDKIADYRDTRNSFETKISKVWDKADVVLSLAEINNNIIKTSGDEEVLLLETTYKFHFTNTSKINQEVIINFEAPSKNSVVTGLKLGLNLELIGQISSRWAARKVYEDSLRRNIDPALIEKVWLNTYSLRVFPIPSKRDTNTGWKQLVEVKILTPITGDSFIYSPKFSVVNLKFDDKSNILSKVYNDGELIKEDIIKNKKIESYISEDHTINKNEFNLDVNNKFEDICLSHFIQFYLDWSFVKLEKNDLLWKKISLFFDNSSSVERNHSNELYDEVYSSFKNYNNKLNDIDIYSYNFDVNKVTEVDDIDYWGASDIDKAIDYIVKNNIKNQRIVFVTDDDSFNFSNLENPTRNLKLLSSNTISVIKIWKRIKTYKSDFNTILSATNWNIYEVNSIWEIDNILAKILNWSDDNLLFKQCDTIENNLIDYSDLTNNVIYSWSSIKIDENIEKIQAWIVSNLLLSHIQNWNDWFEIASLQSYIAEEYNIVNQFNSLIALQTAAQQRDLDRYNQQENKYDVKYKNYWWSDKNVWMIMDTGTESIWLRESDIRFDNNIDFDRMPSRWISINQGSINSNLVNWWMMGDSSINYNLYSWRTDISMIWILLLLIYLLEYIGFINFIIKFVKQK